MGLIHTKTDEAERAIDAQGGVSRPPHGPRVESKAGFKHAPGISALMRTFGR